MATTLFISHGSPDLVLRDHPARDFLVALGKRLPRPSGAMVISAHFETPALTIGAAAAPETIHDFYGFPAALYAMRYPAPGLPEKAERLKRHLDAAGLEARLDPARGLDHGVWSPLSLAWPAADVPLIPISVPRNADNAALMRIGRVLAEFATAHGLWLIGSGVVTHNLRALAPEGQPTPAWAREFHDWVKRHAERGDWHAFATWQTQAPHARLNHPQEEHFAPLVMLAGAMGQAPLVPLHASFMLSSLSMMMLASADLAHQFHQRSPLAASCALTDR